MHTTSLPAEPLSLSSEKRALRQRMRSLRDTLLPSETAAAAAANHALLHPTLLRASCVAVYAALPSELAVEPLIERLQAIGIRVVFPRASKGSPLTFHTCAPSELSVSAFGVREPHPDHPITSLAEIDVFIVPGLAFARNGARLGWGQGYYDRTLPLAPHAKRIGYAFAAQILAAVPFGTNDVRMHAVATEQELITCDAESHR